MNLVAVVTVSSNLFAAILVTTFRHKYFNKKNLKISCDAISIVRVASTEYRIILQPGRDFKPQDAVFSPPAPARERRSARRRDSTPDAIRRSATRRSSR